MNKKKKIALGIVGAVITVVIIVIGVLLLSKGGSSTITNPVGPERWKMTAEEFVDSVLNDPRAFEPYISVAHEEYNPNKFEITGIVIESVDKSNDWLISTPIKGIRIIIDAYGEPWIGPGTESEMAVGAENDWLFIISPNSDIESRTREIAEGWANAGIYQKFRVVKILPRISAQVDSSFFFPESGKVFVKNTRYYLE